MSNMTYCLEVRHLEIEVALKKAPTVRLVPSCRSWRTRSVRLLTRAVQGCQRLAPNRDRQRSGRGLLQLGTRSEFETYPNWGPRVDARRWTVLISMGGLRCVHAGELPSSLGPQECYFQLRRHCLDRTASFGKNMPASGIAIIMLWAISTLPGIGARRNPTWSSMACRSRKRGQLFSTRARA